MTGAEVRHLPTGVYRVFWKGGGTSVAAMGQLYDGRKWLVPANWTSESPAKIATTHHWRLIERLELIAKE
jgi:hypothetical protein